MRVKQQFIGGKWVDSITNQSRDIINPFNQEVIAQVTESSEADAKLAIDAARKAFDQGDWSTMSATERGKIVNKIADLIDRDQQELAEMESLNTGKTVTESIGDMEDIAGVFRYYAEIADKDGGEIIDSPLPHSISKVVREPVVFVDKLRLGIIHCYKLPGNWHLH